MYVLMQSFTILRQSRIIGIANINPANCQQLMDVLNTIAIVSGTWMKAIQLT